MNKNDIFKGSFSKILLALLLVISMISPFIGTPSKAAETITVAEAIANNVGTASVHGYIVGIAISGTSYDQEAPFTVATNVGLADNPNETDPSKILPVQLPSGSVREGINLVNNPQNFKAEVMISGTLGAYFSVPGLRSASAYTIITEGETPPPPPVAEELANIAAARAVTDADKLISVTGTVTTGFGFWGGKAFYIQDDSAGIYVYTSSADVSPGDIVELEGKVSPYSGELQIQPSKITKISSDNVLPAAQEITPAGVNEETQGERILLKNVTITDLTSVNDFGTFEFTATHENGESVVIRNDNRNGLDYATFAQRYKEGELVHVAGIASKFNTTFQVKTLGLESFDLVNKPAVYTDIFPGTVSEGTEIALITPIEGAKIYYTVDGSTPTAASTEYTGKIVLTADTTIKAIAVNDTTSEIFSFIYNVLKVNDLQIRDIQGDGHYSDYTGATVNEITGVVTHLYNSANFVIQDITPDDDNTTSEAIMVNKTSNGLKVGDLVTVAGTVEEWYYEGYSDMKQNDLPITRIRATEAMANGIHELPEPLVINKNIFPPTEIIDNDGLTSFDPAEDGIDFYESVELMRVAVSNAKVVGPQKYGEVIVVSGDSNTTFNDFGGINLSATDYNPERIIVDFDNEEYVAKAGDFYTEDIVGVFGFGFGNYKLWAKASDVPTLQESERPDGTTYIEFKEDKLTVAAYNVENFSTNIENTPDEKVEKIAKSFVDNMKSPDIITLVEVQDNDGPTASGNSDASESYVRLIAAIISAGGPTYEWTDIAPEYDQDGGQPGGNIRVGYLYNPERVTLSEGTKGGSTEAVAWENGELTLNPGRILDLPQQNTRKPLAAQFEFQGEKVVVIGAHLNSKGGDQPLFGKNQPPFLGSEAERIELATMINEFIKKGQEQNPNLKVIVAGDMNDFEFTPALAALKGGILTNMIEKVPAGERFSYYYQGNNQVLDHILVTNNIASRTIVDMVHINANYMEVHGRASDHDPVLIQVSLKNPPRPEPAPTPVTPGQETVTPGAVDTTKDEILLSAPTANAQGEVELTFTLEATEKIVAANKPVVITLNNGSVEISPENFATLAEEGEFSLQVDYSAGAGKLPENANASTPIVDISFVDGDGNPINIAFNEPFIITMSVPEKAEGQVMFGAYYNEISKKWQFVPGKQVDGKFKLQTTHFTSFAVLSNNVSFKDIESNWAKAHIEALASRTIIEGKSTTSFDPSATMTRAEFTVMISRALNLPTTNYLGTFEDVKESQAWAFAGIEAAEKAGIIQGIQPTVFQPGQAITRLEAATMISRILQQYNTGTVEFDTTKKYTDFKDLASQSSSNFNAHIELVLQAGIINGFSDGTFKPSQHITRDQMAKMVHNLLIELEYIQ